MVGCVRSKVDHSARVSVFVGYVVGIFKPDLEHLPGPLIDGHPHRTIDVSMISQIR